MQTVSENTIDSKQITLTLTVGVEGAEDVVIEVPSKLQFSGEGLKALDMYPGIDSVREISSLLALEVMRMIDFQKKSIEEELTSKLEKTLKV